MYWYGFDPVKSYWKLLASLCWSPACLLSFTFGFSICLEFDDIMHQFYDAVRTSEDEECTDSGKPFTYFVSAWFTCVVSSGDALGSNYVPTIKWCVYNKYCTLFFKIRMLNHLSMVACSWLFAEEKSVRGLILLITMPEQSSQWVGIKMFFFSFHNVTVSTFKSSSLHFVLKLVSSSSVHVKVQSLCDTLQKL